MTAYDLRVGTGNQAPALSAPALYRPYYVVDFAATPYVSGDTLKVLNVPKNCVVLATGYELITAEGAASTSHTLGDSNSATTYFGTVINANGTAGVIATSNTLGSPIVAKLYTAANYLLFTLGADISHAKIAFFAWIMKANLDN